MISTDRLRIGSVQFSDLVVRYAPENTPLFVKLQFDELKMDAMKEGRTNKIQLYSELAYFTKEYGLISFPVTGKIDFQINKNFLPKEVAAEISLEHPKGKIFDHMLQDSSLNGRLALLFPDDHPHQIVIKQLQIDQIDQDKTIFSMKGNGVLDVAEKQGKCRIT